MQQSRTRSSEHYGSLNGYHPGYRTGGYAQPEPVY